MSQPVYFIIYKDLFHMFGNVLRTVALTSYCCFPPNLYQLNLYICSSRVNKNYLYDTRFILNLLFKNPSESPSGAQISFSPSLQFYSVGRYISGFFFFFRLSLAAILQTRTVVSTQLASLEVIVNPFPGRAGPLSWFV